MDKNRCPLFFPNFLTNFHEVTNKTDMCFQHTKGHENVIASPKGVAIPPRLLHFVRNDKRRTITKKVFTEEI